MRMGDFKIDVIQQNPILILDFGSQYTQLIARRLREIGVYCEIHPYNLNTNFLDSFKPVGIILSGGPASVIGSETPKAPSWVYTAGVPVLGICYGMQTMALQLGGFVSMSDISEFGHTDLSLTDTTSIFANLDLQNQHKLHVWMSHGDKVTALPPGFKTIAKTDSTQIAAMENKDKHFYGVQFHPEVTHTQQGPKILANFAFNICNAVANWTSKSIIKSKIAAVREQVGNDDVILGLSGGVDSSVVAALLNRAIGKQLICVFVDTGLLRHNEVANVKSLLEENAGINIVWVDAKDKFLSALAGITCPEEKRKIIGKLFVDIFDAEARKRAEVKWLAQGTIYSDVIESAATATHADSTEVIKSHHNVGGLPKDLRFKLVEPLRELFKDEVRQIGVALGLSKEIVYRHPFPGVGLGIRVMGEVKPQYLALLRAADHIFIQELHKADLYYKVSQAFVVFLPIKSVGVKGDGRSYDYVVSLRAVETTDFMTAEWSRLPWDFLSEVSKRIINEVKGISRVVYDISGKPPATIEWE